MSPDLQMSSSGLNKMIGYQNGCFCNGYQVTYPIAGVGYTFLIRFVHLSFLRKLLSHRSCISCTLNEKKEIFILKNIFLVCWVIFLHLLTMEGFEILTLVMAYFLFLTSPVASLYNIVQYNKYLILLCIWLQFSKSNIQTLCLFARVWLANSLFFSMIASQWGGMSCCFLDLKS